jgi:2-polyprenyl-6-methoxyphenol hydroxylase-like FAD-dependent oxidoreductase
MDYETDVVVVGAGSAGMVAAIAAARNGASTLLIERGGFLGGISTAVLDTMYAFYAPGEAQEKVVSGLPDEIVERIAAYDAVLRRPNTFGSGTGITYNPETLKRVWDDLAREAGVRVVLQSFVTGALKAGDRVTGVSFVNKGGAHTVKAKIVIDASGDADVVAHAGGDYELAGRDSAQQTLTTTFRMANVDERALAVKKDELHALMREANRSGRFSLPREEGSVHRTPDQGIMATIMTRVPGVAPEDVEGLSRAEAEGRAQAFEYFRFLRSMVPGYENAVLIATSPWIGVRETRRIVGDYQLTGEDVLAARRFPDGIARCGAPIEDHHAGRDTRWAYIPNSGTYAIPFRALLPRNLDGIIVAGRCLSSTHDAHASARSIGTCMAMGQAAGTAAALAVRDGVSPRRLSTALLLERLDRQGADFGQRPRQATDAA